MSAEPRETAPTPGPVSAGEEPPAEARDREAPRRRPRWLAFLLYGGAAGLAVLSLLEAALHVIGNDDLWWHLATGRYITENQTIPRTDVFSHTHAGQPWVNLEWLSHFLLYNVAHHLGEDALFPLRLGMILLIFGVTLALCRLRSRSWLISLTTVALGAWVCQPFLDARPQLFTFLFAILTLFILERFRRHGRDHLFWLPVILLLWTNLHGGYVFGLCLLIGNVAAESGKRLLSLPADPLPWPAIRRLARVTLAAAVAVLVNPWTFGAYGHLAEIFGGGGDIYLEGIQEWLPPEPFTSGPFNPLQFWLFLPLLALVALPVALVRWRDFDWNDVSMALVVAVFFAFQHRRFIPLFTILTLPLLAWSVRFWVDRWLESGWRGKPAAELRMRAAAAAAALCWMVLVGVLPYRLLHLHRRYAEYVHSDVTLFRANIQHRYYPDEAIRLAREIGIRGRMLNFYNWGGYLQWAFPERKVFIDGRGWMSYGLGYYNDYLRVHYGFATWKSVLELHDVTWALLHRGENAALLRALDADPHWTQIFAGDNSAIVLRRSLGNRSLLARFRARELPLPDTAMTHFLYGRRAEDDGDLELAARDFAKAVALAPENDRFRAHLILALAAAGRLEDAEREVRRGLEQRPGSVPIRLAAARLALEAGDERRAFELFEEAFRLAPDSDEAIDGMLEVDLERAGGVIEGDGDASKPWASYARARLAEAEGDVERARKHYETEAEAADRGGARQRKLHAQRAMSRLEES